MAQHPYEDEHRRRSEHEDDYVPDRQPPEKENTFFHVPRSLFYLAVAAIPTMLITGTTFVVVQTIRTGDLERRTALLDANLERRAVVIEAALDRRTALVDEKLARLDAKIETTAATNEANRAATNDLVNKVDLRLARIEAQLTFLVSTYAAQSAPARR